MDKSWPILCQLVDVEVLLSVFSGLFTQPINHLVRFSVGVANGMQLCASETLRQTMFWTKCFSVIRPVAFLQPGYENYEHRQMIYRIADIDRNYLSLLRCEVAREALQLSKVYSSLKEWSCGNKLIRT